MVFTEDGFRPERRFFLVRMLCYGAAAGAAAVGRRVVGFGQEKKSRLLATIKIADHPSLAKVGGFVTVEGTPVGDLLIIRASNSEYASLSPVCPHKQCTVHVLNPAMIQCPCHKSSYKIDGTYIRGPAKASLRKFVTNVDGGVLTTLED
jgi:Rieske Fe-S protein